MKRKLNKEEYEKLSDALKANYKEKNGAYILDIEDDEEAIEALRRAKDNESDSHRETKKQLKQLQEKLDELTNEGSRKRGDIEAIEKSWKEKLEKRETELTTELTKLKTNLSSSTKDSVIGSLAAKLVKPESHRIFKKSIEDRFNIELNGDAPTVRILTADGKPSAMSIEDLEKEILANKEYAPIIIASRASGGAGKPETKGGGAPFKTGDNNAPIPLAMMKPSDLAASITERKRQQE